MLNSRAGMLATTPRHSGARRSGASPESIPRILSVELRGQTTFAQQCSVVMDSGPAPYGASRNDDAERPVARDLLRPMLSNPGDRGPELGELLLECFHPRQRLALVLLFGQAKADDIDPPARDRTRDQHDGVEHKRRALLRRAVEMDVEIVGQRQGRR